MGFIKEQVLFLVLLTRLMPYYNIEYDNKY
jgi:hypothetical protein